jgi:hypothetical protein
MPISNPSKKEMIQQAVLMGKRITDTLVELATKGRILTISEDIKCRGFVTDVMHSVEIRSEEVTMTIRYQRVREITFNKEG